jgi:hypothetical protein
MPPSVTEKPLTAACGERAEASVKQFSTFFRVLCFDAYRKMQQANQKQGSGQ